MRLIISLLSGGLFGLGLFISGMTDTNRVQGWLDLFGEWDPTLAFVMGGAIIPMFFAWRFTVGRAPVFGESFPSQTNTRLSKDLIVGATLFGVGWGLAGLCPGPALASLSFGGSSGWVFLAAMVAGMWIALPVKKMIAQ